MATEIERRFLVREVGFLSGLQGEPVIQGYVSKEPGSMSTRVRMRGTHATIALESTPAGAGRGEYEYDIPLDDALEILDKHCAGCTIAMTRYRVESAQHVFEVDVFHGRHAGLVIARIMLHSPDEPFEPPLWLGPEITHETRYGDFALALLQGTSTTASWPQ